MLKRINWKQIFKVFAWLVCLAGMVVLMSFIHVKQEEVKCSAVKIIVRGVDNFIESEEISALLKQDQGELVGKRLTTINIHEIEKSLTANPYIAFAKVFTDMDGIIRITVKQRQPVLRVLNAAGQDYYIDSDGFKMPMSPNFTADVLVATGSIMETFGGRVDTLRTPLAKDLYRTAVFMKKDSLWDAQIEQIYVTENTDIELVPRVGNQRIILGTADSLQTKMRNLLAFYKQAMPMVGWNAYKTINLKYVNQIVCEKYDSLTIKKVLAEAKSDSVKATKAKESIVQQTINSEIKSAMGTAEPIKKVEPKSLTEKPKAIVAKEKPVAKEAKKPTDQPAPKAQAPPAKTSGAVIKKPATTETKVKAPATVKTKPDNKKPT